MNANDTAQQLLQNQKFVELFQRALGGGGGDGGGEVGDMLKEMPKEGDPKREAWLRKLQARLQEETNKEAKRDLEQVHSDEQGQWMFVLPDPGFCIKTTVTGGLKVFINVCQHARIGEPVPMEPEKGGGGQGEAEDAAEMRYRIPISCGQARPAEDKGGKPCKVYDVIVNPATIRRCGEEHEFRRFVAALCMQWIKQKSEPTLNADEFRNLNFKCKGTLEPQRIRLSTQPKAHNAMGDEIRLPSSANGATAPSQVNGAQGTGRLVQEVEPVRETATATSATAAATATTVATPPTPVPAVREVTAEGTYDWSTHARPGTNPYFKDTVPATFTVTLFLPGILTIREVDVRVGHRRVDCYYVDDVAEAEGREQDGGPSPFLSVTLDYPLSDNVVEAKYVRKTSLLRLKLAVRLPDETLAPATRPERDVTEVEAEEQQRAQAAREQEWAAAKAQRDRQLQEEAEVMAERRSYVENLSAVQSGDVPPVIRDEVDQMPRDQLPAMLHRLEGRIRKGDSIDTLLDKLPDPMLDALINHIREKLSLQPRLPRQTTTSAASPSSSSSTALVPPPTTAAPVATATNTPPPPPPPQERDPAIQEFNVTKQSEALFGVAFHNRYLFALD
ncbi:pre-RNA processing PIH1/Nop17 [Novymonas esmeraldas]|uniref:PIH1 domain-containing protein 1 n=1 Tax=Novymonas esmeraldas TaxID=1808958 RepID=A0AAW0F4W1_9TRYP